MNMWQRGHSAFSALPKKQNVPSDQRGSILLPIVVAIALLAAITFMLSYQSVSETNIASGEFQRDRLRYVAEAGIAHAKQHLSNNTSCENYTGIPQTDFAGETYTAQFVPNTGSPIKIRASVAISGGNTLTLESAAVPAYQSQSTVIFQPGEPGEDTHILEDDPTGNHGNDNNLMTDAEEGGKGPVRTLLRFDLSTVPYGSRVLLAALDIYQHTESGDGDVVEAHGLLHDWDESANWSTSNGSAAWTTPGGDYNPNVESSFVAAGIGWKTLDLTDLAGQWVDGRKPNYGVLLLSPPASGNRENIYYSSDDSQSSLRPKLTLVYACECGKTCVTVPAGKNVLLVVGNDVTLASKDADRKVLMESWGHTVTVIDDGDSQASFDAAAAAADVVYVSGTIGGGALADKLTGSGTPIVNEFYGKLDNFGFSSSTTAVLNDVDAFTITDAAHDITSPFNGNAVTVYAQTLTMPVPSGTLAPDLQRVAEIGFIPALVALETGAERWDGTFAPARRVYLPFSSAETNQLTDDGRTIMRRALDWAATIGSLSGTFLDQFNAIAYDGNDGTLDWSDVWFETGESDGPGGGDFSVVSSSWCASGNCLQIREDRASSRQITREASLAGAATASLSFNYRRRHVSSPIGGTITLEISADGGANFIPVKVFQMDTQDSDQLVDTFDITAYIAANTQIRFSTSNDLYETAMYIDNVLIDTTPASPTGPIAHWKLDDGIGTTALDSVGGNDGTLTNGPVWIAGQLGDALDFDGSNDYVITNSNFTPPPVGTASFWMRVSGSPASHGRILGLDDTWEIRHVTTGTPDGIPYGLVFDLGVTGVNTEFVTTTTIDTPGHWYHIVATYDTDTDAYGVYIDGSPHKSGTYPSALSVPAANDLSFGTRTGSSNYFDGSLDDIRIYDRILSAAEISDLYTSGGGSGGGGGSCDGNFRDEFNATSFSGDDGSLPWTADWLEVGESNGPTSGDIQVMHGQSDYQLRTRDNDNGGEGVEREADLSGASTATLSYSYGRVNLDNSGDYTSVEVSGNGASGPWTELTRHAGPDNDSSYQPASHDISSFISPNTRIRFKTSSSMGGTDTVWFDNVEIVCTP